MIHKLKSYMGQNPDCQGGDVFEMCNILQYLPDTQICIGRSGLVFRNCNMINVIVPVGSLVIECNTAKKDFCTHIHPEMGLPPEAENCRHMVDINELIVDGVQVAISYNREDTNG